MAQVHLQRGQRRRLRRSRISRRRHGQGHQRPRRRGSGRAHRGLAEVYGLAEIVRNRVHLSRRQATGGSPAAHRTRVTPSYSRAGVCCELECLRQADSCLGSHHRLASLPAGRQDDAHCADTDTLLREPIVEEHARPSIPPLTWFTSSPGCSASWSISKTAGARSSPRHPRRNRSQQAPTAPPVRGTAGDSNSVDADPQLSRGLHVLCQIRLSTSSWMPPELPILGPIHDRK